MSRKLDEFKALILFAKEHGIKSFKFGNTGAVFGDIKVDLVPVETSEQPNQSEVPDDVLYHSS